MVAYEKICLDERPDWIVVVGDVNSTLASALVGAKLCIPVAHLEAGLRSRDRTMPEEVNRIVTDAIADLLWTPSSDADDNLRKEGIAAEKIDRVGNVMIDSYELLKEKIGKDATRERLGLIGATYGVVTLHRPSNVDNRETLSLLVDQLKEATVRVSLVFAVHPRTRKQLETFRLMDKIANATGLIVTEPLGYIQFMNLVQGAQVVITDSGGIQEETTYLQIPCLTIRETTERPITIEEGTNTLVRPEALLSAIGAALQGSRFTIRCPALWDGRAALRVAQSLRRRVETVQRGR
jgi:UDP-N-acetylglucosamine 2-epimerase (non-hydrolysing)